MTTTTPDPTSVHIAGYGDATPEAVLFNPDDDRPTVVVRLHLPSLEHAREGDSGVWRIDCTPNEAVSLGVQLIAAAAMARDARRRARAQSDAAATT